MNGTVWTERSRNAVIGLLAVIAVVIAGWALRAAFVVTMPLAFALFVAMLVQPLRRRLAERLPERWNWLSVAAAMLVILAVLALFAGAIWLSIELVGNKAPQYADKLQSQWDMLVSWARQNNLPVPQDLAQGGGLRGRLGQWAVGVVRSVWEVLGFLVLIFFFALLMLLEIRAADAA